jgi:hypothetical protein
MRTMPSGRVIALAVAVEGDDVSDGSRDGVQQLLMNGLSISPTS